jgi:hypothetical protein
MRRLAWSSSVGTAKMDGIASVLRVREEREEREETSTVCEMLCSEGLVCDGDNSAPAVLLSLDKDGEDCATAILVEIGVGVGVSL